MASWGNLDNVLLSGNVTIATASNVVSGFGGAVFLEEVDPGDYITIGGIKNQVEFVNSNSEIILSTTAGANGANVKAYVQQGPKYVHDNALTDNTYTIHRIVGIDRNEAIVDSNNDKGINSPGWVHYFTYTDGFGATRHKAETLVAMSKNFNANVTGHLVNLDGDDDSIAADYWIYFVTQPTSTEVAANANVEFQVEASSIPDGASITYLWQESPNNIVYADLSDAGVYTGTDSNLLAISDTTGLKDYYYRVIISATGADNNTSTEAQVTFAEEE